MTWHPLTPISLGAQQLRDRNFLLGNKQGFFLNLPVANGTSLRTLHRSKWYGAYRYGRKFLEAIVLYGPDGRLLSRHCQTGFAFDGISAERRYLLQAPSREDVGPGPMAVTEEFFVPDNIPGIVWRQSGDAALTVEPRFAFRFYRGGDPVTSYTLERSGEALMLSRVIPVSGDEESVHCDEQSGLSLERLWGACAVIGGQIRVHAQRRFSRSAWYGADAERRRYLRHLAAQAWPVVEHAPRWERAADRRYNPLTVGASDGTMLLLSFGHSRDEVIDALHALMDSMAGEDPHVYREKRDRLHGLLAHASYATGHWSTDQAHGHVLSRMVDGLVADRVEVAGSHLTAPTTAILAGNAYFQEAWKRDENIALGGMLATGQYELARRVIESTWQRQDLETGRLPLRLRDGEAPAYTSSDGTLWALWRLSQYYRRTGDGSVLDTKLPLIVHFFARSLARCWQGLLPSGGVAIPGHDWETWMDTEFSPRAGYPVEIQLLWLACLQEYGELLRDRDVRLADHLREVASELRTSLSLFEHDGYLVDHLTYERDQVKLLSPNAYFGMSLDVDLGWEREEHMLALARTELAGVSGVRTLARSQWAEVLGPEVAGLARQRRPLPSIGKMNYHRGVEWNWLAQLFVAGELRHGRPDVAFNRYLSRQIANAIGMAGLGGISELYDHRGPTGPDYQTWSMSGLLEALHRFAGFHVDVPRRQMTVRPQKPRSWPYVRSRAWYGRCAVDLAYTEAPIRGSRSRGVRQRDVLLTFDGMPPEEVRLDVEFVLGERERVRRVLVDANGRELEARGWTELDRPRRAQVSLRASEQQRICIEVYRSDRRLPPATVPISRDARLLYDEHQSNRAAAGVG